MGFTVTSYRQVTKALSHNSFIILFSCFKKKMLTSSNVYTKLFCVHNTPWIRLTVQINMTISSHRQFLNSQQPSKLSEIKKYYSVPMCMHRFLNTSDSAKAHSAEDHGNLAQSYKQHCPALIMHTILLPFPWLSQFMVSFTPIQSPCDS